jgi:formylglycine-generating enzyme required for sulfatase activity
MVGNVATWTEDAFDRYPPSNVPLRDPRNDNGPLRVIRGVGWSERRRHQVRCAARQRLAPDDHDTHLGFRCAIKAP